MHIFNSEQFLFDNLIIKDVLINFDWKFLHSLNLNHLQKVWEHQILYSVDWPKGWFGSIFRGKPVVISGQQESCLLFEAG